MLPRNAKPCFFWWLLLLVAGVPVWGQSWAGKRPPPGQIKDESGKPIEGAKITLRNGSDAVDPKTDGPASRSPPTRTASGPILGLAGGAWGILIEKQGYMPSEGQVTGQRVRRRPADQHHPEGAPQGADPAGPEGAGERRRPGQGGHRERQQPARRRASTPRPAPPTRLGMSKLEDKTLHPAILRAIADSYYKEGKTDQAIDTLKKSLPWCWRADDPGDPAAARQPAGGRRPRARGQDLHGEAPPGDQGRRQHSA